MGIKSNRYFNDPAIAQGLANLAGLFEPPSGSDEAGYALARERDMQTSQRQALFDYANSANYDQEIADRLGVVADLYDPTQSYRAVDVDATTKMRGQDIESGDRRYIAGVESGDRRYDTDVDAQTAITQALLTPVAENATRFIPAGTPGLDALFAGNVPATQSGNISVGRGETVHPAGGGEVIKGDAIPLTKTELDAQHLAEMIAAAEAAGDPAAATRLMKESLLGTETSEYFDPVTGKPKLGFRFDAAEQGQQPVLEKSKEEGIAFSQLPEEQRKQSVLNIKEVDTYHAVDPQGKERSFIGYLGSDGRIYEQGSRVPAQGVVSKGEGGNQFAIDFNPDGTVAGIRQGAGVGKAPTEKQLVSEYIGGMAEGPTRNLLTAFEDDSLMPTDNDLYWNIAASEARDTEGSGLITRVGQKFGAAWMQNQMTEPGRNFIQNMKTVLPMQVFQQSGQGVTEKEYWRKLEEFMPAPGEPASTRQLKARQLAQFIVQTYKMAKVEPPKDIVQYLAGKVEQTGGNKIGGTGAATAAPAATTPPAGTSEPAAAEAAPAAPAAAEEGMSAEDRAASIAGAKAAIAKNPGARAQIIERLKTGIPDFKEEELQ